MGHPLLRGLATLQPKTHRHLAVALAAFALLVLVAGSARVAPATAAAKPCWERILEDWSDGTITGTYAVECYRQALRAMPEDVRLYSSASDDIKRALAARISSPRRVAGVHTGVPPAAVATQATSGGKGLPVAPVALGGALAIVGALVVLGLYVWNRRVKRRSRELAA
jgi:hypothetical protein